MKKFSKIINQVINEEPVKSKKIDESDVFKYKVLDLMDRYLRISVSGPIDNRLFAGLVSIEGKEMLMEALIDLLAEKTNKEQTVILESLKNEISDWEAIDNKIDSLKKDNVSLENRIKLKKVLERYDEESLLLYLENNSKKITNIKTLNDYTKILENSNLTNSTKQKSIDIYQKRINEL